MTDIERSQLLWKAWFDYCFTNRHIAYGEVPSLTEEQIEEYCKEQYKKDFKKKSEGGIRMIDEGLAKEYAHDRTYHEAVLREDGTEYAKEVSSVTTEQAFLDGLKAGSQLGIKAISTESMLKELLDRGVIHWK